MCWRNILQFVIGQIHPELFDKLDGVWSTLEKFQKTRGVLRFMAAVISELWQRDDRNLLIMPPSAPVTKSPDGTAGQNLAGELLTQAANRPRTHRNGLIFLAAEESQLQRLRESTASLLAWRGIDRGQDSLELTAADKKMSAAKVEEFERTTNSQLGDAWSMILVPESKNPKSPDITWLATPCAGHDDKPRTVRKKLCDKEILHQSFNPFHLHRELERHLWGKKNHIASNRHHPQPGMHCSWCQYRNECLAWLPGMTVEEIKRAA